MNAQNNIPEWKLDSLFSSLDSNEYKTYLGEYESLKDSVAQLLEMASSFTIQANSDFDFPKWLAHYLEIFNSLISHAKTISAYAYIIYSTDTTNPKYMNNLAESEKIQIQVQQMEIKFTSLLVAHQNLLGEFYARFPDYTEYKFLINEKIEQSKHLMNINQEKLAAELNQTGGNAWSLLQEQIISNLQDKNGRTFNEIRNLAFSSDPQTRKDAWQTEKALLEQFKIPLAASLNNLKGQTVILNKKRNWQNSLEHSLFTSRISKATLDALISSIEESLPVWQKYFRAKAQLLRKTSSTASETAGTEKEKGIAFYDLFAPIETADEENSLLAKQWTFEEAKNYVVQKYASFSKEMSDFAQNAFDSGWIDAKVRSGKVGGAYDEDFPKSHQSRILTNFTGTFSDIITLAHEIGHAYHFYCMKNKPALFFDYPMTLAETASTFAETIVKQDMIKNSSSQDKIKILDIDLQDASQVLVDILCRFYFEKSVFEAREKAELTAEDFCTLMKNAQEKTYGSGLNGERHEYMWALKCHYYITDFDFYNYPYAFGQLFAAALYEKSKTESSHFAQTYADLLSKTGSMSCEELCLNAGFDITKKEFWACGIKMYTKEVEEFISLAQKI